MSPSILRTVLRAMILALAACAAMPTLAEEGPFPPVSGEARAAPSQAQLDQLLAPIALYPDDLLAQVLAASTYPLEVVALHRFLEAHPGLAAAALDDAIAGEPWDASVKALAPFPSVVAMMDGQLEWMQRLGDAFLASEAAVMDTVQALRHRAAQAGNLQDNERERVIVEREVIRIEPAVPDVLYVPVYDPWTVYGPWWWPAYPPYAWGVSYFGPWDYYYGGLYFGVGFYVGGWHSHAHPDWHEHDVHWRHPGGSEPWRHDPRHRGGVPYMDPRSRDRYGRATAPHVGERRDFRGFDVRPGPPRAPSTGQPFSRLSPQAPSQPFASPRGPSQPSVSPHVASQPGARPPHASAAQPSARPSSTPQGHPFARTAPSTSPIAPSPGHATAQQSARGHQSLGSAPGHSREHR